MIRSGGTLRQPLGDKTPFPNRVANRQFQNLNENSKFPVVSFLDSQGLDSALRPSSARKQIRPRKSGGRNFETPANRGNHWEAGEISFAEPEAEVQETLPQDDYDEIEYMAPNTLDLPYQPPFDFELPDYKEVGRSLMKLAYSFPLDDSSQPVEIHINEEEIPRPTWDLLTLPELESDDPFHQSPVPQPPPVPSSKFRTVSRTMAGVASKTAPAAKTSYMPPKNSAPLRGATAPKPAPPLRSTTTPTTTTRSVPISRKSSGTTGTAVPSRTLPSGLSRPRAGTTKPSLPATTTIPPRPATSAAIRSRVVSTVTHAKAAASLQRPSTSASSYKATTLARKPAASGGNVVPGPRRVANKAGTVGGRALSGTVNSRARSANEDDGGLVVRAGEIEVDEFMFDV